MKWISVKDRLPEVGEYVDIYSTYHRRVVDVEFESIDSFYDNNKDMTYTDVTHWMLSPEPPKKI